MSQTCESSVDSEPVKLGGPRGGVYVPRIPQGVHLRVPLSFFRSYLFLFPVLFQEWLKVSILQRNREPLGHILH